MSDDAPRPLSAEEEAYLRRMVALGPTPDASREHRNVLRLLATLDATRASVPALDVELLARDIEALRTSPNRLGSTVDAFMDGVYQSAALVRAACHREATP